MVIVFAIQIPGSGRSQLKGIFAIYHIIMVMYSSLFGFITTKLAPVYTDHHQRRACSHCLRNSKEMVLLYLKSGCYTLISCQDASYAVFVFFVPLGCIHRRQMRESPMSLPRFSGDDFFDLSSMMLPQDLQLNPKPQSCLPMRLLVEPLALWLVRFQEALGEDNCRFFLSEFSSNRLAGSNCVLRHRQCAFSVVYLAVVCLDTYFISDSESTSCMSYLIIVYYF
jgi:hypothetical protein